jgi:hypothetical protein
MRFSYQFQFCPLEAFVHGTIAGFGFAYPIKRLSWRLSSDGIEV